MITHNDVKYLIVQAGGLGTRLGKHTANKPKCLVPVHGAPLIEHTLRQFAHCTVIVIGDYCADLLEQYLQLYCGQYSYRFVRTNQSGTAAGLDQAVAMIPENTAFAITWSDLLFTQPPQYAFDKPVAVALTNQFECRWSWDQDGLQPTASNTHGVAGFFVFRDSSQFSHLTTDQSFVRGFMRAQYTLDQVETFWLNNCVEVGQMQAYEQMISTQRFFNSVQITDHTVIKQCTVPEYAHLIQDEIRWYRAVGNQIGHVPQVLSEQPLTLQRIRGQHPHQIDHDRQIIVERYCDVLHKLHSLNTSWPNFQDCVQVYAHKPIQRTARAMQWIPHATQPHIRINNKWCENPMIDPDNFQSRIPMPSKFSIIHGDPTFSNTLIDKNLDLWLIDPRGRFGQTAVCGDPRYDWAKLWYSAVGNYDSINSKRFRVQDPHLGPQLSIESLGYESFADQILSASGMTRSTMNFLHSTIWFSLVDYVKEDVDAMMYAFYQGVYLWNQQ
jgi:GTP:adenosylcobinamide-phosphate guanylyltransferase/thiamine kinase-like enzyme